MSGLSSALLLAASIAASVAPAASSQSGRAIGRAVTIFFADGRTITASYVEANRAAAPAVVLVPMLGRTKDDWNAVTEGLVRAGITALAIDLPDNALPQDSKALAGWQAAVAAAVDYLFVRPDGRGAAIGVAGASLGATLAVMAAADDPRIRSLALVSPSLDYRGLGIQGPLKAYGERPAQLLASRADPYAARSVRELAAAAPGPREVVWSDIAAHGTFLLDRHPDLARSLVEWFQRTLG